MPPVGVEAVERAIKSNIKTKHVLLLELDVDETTSADRRYRVEWSGASLSPDSSAVGGLLLVEILNFEVIPRKWKKDLIREKSTRRIKEMVSSV